MIMKAIVLFLIVVLSNCILDRSYYDALGKLILINRNSRKRIPIINPRSIP
jgi:hypothetical protein